MRVGSVFAKERARGQNVALQHLFLHIIVTMGIGTTCCMLMGGSLGVGVGNCFGLANGWCFGT